MNGGELLQYTLKNWPLQKHTVRFLFQQLVLGVGYLHSHWCIHRDLKPTQGWTKRSCLMLFHWGVIAHRNFQIPTV